MVPTTTGASSPAHVALESTNRPKPVCCCFKIFSKGETEDVETTEQQKKDGVSTYYRPYRPI